MRRARKLVQQARTQKADTCTENYDRNLPSNAPSSKLLQMSRAGGDNCCNVKISGVVQLTGCPHMPLHRLHTRSRPLCLA